MYYRSSYKENNYNTSTSSLNSSISSSSSIQSLNVLSSSASYSSPTKFKSFGATKPEPSDNKTESTSRGSNKDLIRNLQQNLDKVLAQKNSISKQLEELTAKVSYVT